MDDELFATLTAVGLTDGEAKTYLALLALGNTPVGPVIEKAAISASKAYQILDRLVQKGLATTMLDDGVKVYGPADPQMLLNLLQAEHARIEANRQAVESVLPRLKARREAAGTFPIVELSRGRCGFERLHDECTHAAAPGTPYVVVAGNRISFKAQGYWSTLSRDLAAKRIPQYQIYEHQTWHGKPADVHRRHERTRYYPRVLPQRYADLPDISVLGDRCLIIDVEDDELFTLIIRHARLAGAIQKLLAYVYDTGETPDGFPKGPRIASPEDT